MRFVDIHIFHIGQTKVNREEVQRWMQFLEASKEFVKEIGKVDISDPALLIGLAAKRCYKSFEPGMNPNVTKVRRNWTEYLDNVLSQKHGSVLEHSVHNFAFENVSRVFTGEMNRHRAGVAISEGSMRYIRYRDIPMWLPNSIRLTEAEREELAALAEEEDLQLEYLPMEGRPERIRLMLKKWHSQRIFQRSLEGAEQSYHNLQEIWKDELADGSPFKGKKHVTSMMRRAIPMGVATGGVWSLNIRALRHVMALRSSPAAEEEILEVWSRAGKIMVESEPELFGDFKQTSEGFWVPKYEKV